MKYLTSFLHLLFMPIFGHIISILIIGLSLPTKANTVNKDLSNSSVTLRTERLKMDKSDCVLGTWTGSINSDWNEPLNWCNGSIPTISTNVVIPMGGQPIIGEPSFCNDITISTGATLTISGTNMLTVNGNWTNQGTFIPNSSTVIFNGGIQSINNKGTYYNLMLSGTGTKTLKVQLRVMGTFTIDNGVTFITSDLFLGFEGDFIGVPFNAGKSNVNFSGSANQNIAGFTASGIVSMSKNGGTVTFTGNVKGDNLIVQGAGVGTLHLGVGKTHEFTGNMILTSGTLNGGSSLMKIGGPNSSRTNGNFIAGTGTVEYSSSAAYPLIMDQICLPVVYYNLNLYSASANNKKSFSTSPTVNGSLSIQGNAFITITNGTLQYGPNASLQYNTNISRTVSSVEWTNPFTATGGVIINNTGTIRLDQSKTFNDHCPLKISNGATLNTTSTSNKFSSSSTITIDGTLMTSNSEGFSGSYNTAISSSDNPLILLGINSVIEYTSTVQKVSAGTYSNLKLSAIGGTKTIAAGTEVTVNGSLTGTSNLIINSDEINSGSLIVKGSSDITVTYNRWYNHSGDTYSRWYITSAPVYTTSFNSSNNAAKIHVDATVNPKLYDFATYSEPNNDWLYEYPSANAGNLPGTLTRGQGYLISLDPSSDGIIQFSGVLNGTVNKSVTTSSESGWNAVGNPYTSAIGITGSALSTENFLSKNQGILNPSYAAIYVWNETGFYDQTQQYYKVIGNSGYTSPEIQIGSISENCIQTGQGFLINSNLSSNIVFTKEMQINQTNLNLKSARESWPGLTLSAECNGQTRSTIVAFNEKMTPGLDTTYDAGLLASDYFQFFTHLADRSNSVDFAIQCLPDHQYSEISIPLGIQLPEGGEIIFRASGMILPPEIFPVIEDKELNIKTTLKTETDGYSVILPKNTGGVGRFYLSFVDLTSWKQAQPKMEKYRASLTKEHIVLYGSIEPETNVQLFDIYGHKIAEYHLTDTNLPVLNLPDVDQQIYLLKITCKGFSQVLKLPFIKN